MSDKIGAAEFHAAPGTSDWRVVFGGARTRFRTGSFAQGLALVDEIGRLAEAADHHPDIDLRYGLVEVRLISHDVGGLSRRDISLAEKISAAAASLGLVARPAEVQTVQIALDATDEGRVRPFWEAVFGYPSRDDGVLADPAGRLPNLWFQPMAEPRTERNRFHLDIAVPIDQGEARVHAALAAGGRLVSDANAPQWWTLADPEGNEVDIATMLGRG